MIALIGKRKSRIGFAPSRRKYREHKEECYILTERLEITRSVTRPDDMLGAVFAASFGFVDHSQRI
jgi:hypothetical protein